MQIKIIAFGIAKDILNGKTINFNLNGGQTIAHLKEELCEKYPDFDKLKSFSIAVNEEYQEDSFIIKEADEVVIIPPVSGG